MVLPALPVHPEGKRCPAAVSPVRVLCGCLLGQGGDASVPGGPGVPPPNREGCEAGQGCVLWVPLNVDVGDLAVPFWSCSLGQVRATAFW